MYTMPLMNTLRSCKMTKEEFEIKYAVDAGLLIPHLRILGLEAAPCDCGDPDCPGWRMVSIAKLMRSRGIFFVDSRGKAFEERGKC